MWYISCVLMQHKLQNHTSKPIRENSFGRFRVPPGTPPSQKPPHWSKMSGATAVGTERRVRKAAGGGDRDVCVFELSVSCHIAGWWRPSKIHQRDEKAEIRQGNPSGRPPEPRENPAKRQARHSRKINRRYALRRFPLSPNSSKTNPGEKRLGIFRPLKSGFPVVKRLFHDVFLTLWRFRKVEVGGLMDWFASSRWFHRLENYLTGRVCARESERWITRGLRF